MNKLFCIGTICAVVLGFWGWKQAKTSITAVLPEKCVFFMDKELSPSFQNNLTSIISAHYADKKNPQELMDQMAAQFKEIRSMQVQICQTDKICFYVDAAKPMFLLNNSLVVCDNQIQVAREHFTSEATEDLVQLHCSTDCDIATMLQFVERLPDSFKKKFTIEWVSNFDIVLHPIDTVGYVLRVSYDSVFGEQDLAACQSIHDGLPKKSKNKKSRMTYDIRFKNQIIVTQGGA